MQSCRLVACDDRIPFQFIFHIMGQVTCALLADSVEKLRISFVYFAS